MEFTAKFAILFLWSLYFLSPLLLILGAIVIALGQLVGKFEGWSKFDALYWSLITATTVGYGDIRAIKRSSRMLSIVIAMAGIVFAGIIVTVTIHSASIVIEEYITPEMIDKLKRPPAKSRWVGFGLKVQLRLKPPETTTGSKPAKAYD